MDLTQLEQRITAIEDYIAERKRQQISDPLDIVSEAIMLKRVLKFENKSTATVVADKSIKVVIDGQSYQINAR